MQAREEESKKKFARFSPSGCKLSAREAVFQRCFHELLFYLVAVCFVPLPVYICRAEAKIQCLASREYTRAARLTDIYIYIYAYSERKNFLGYSLRALFTISAAYRPNSETSVCKNTCSCMGDLQK